MQHKLWLLYAWLVRTLFFFLPDVPPVMRLRGFLYGIGMEKCGRNFQVAHSAIINGLDLCSIGRDVYIANNCNFVLNGRLEIGNEVIFGPGVVVSSGDHQFDGKSFRFSESKKENVSIGNGCWIGGNSTLLGGACVPDKSVVAAGAVVNKKSCGDESAVYAGVPAKIVKKLW